MCPSDAKAGREARARDPPPPDLPLRLQPTTARDADIDPSAKEGIAA
jgi:hypothetical protein